MTSPTHEPHAFHFRPGPGLFDVAVAAPRIVWECVACKRDWPYHRAKCECGQRLRPVEFTSLRYK